MAPGVLSFTDGHTETGFGIAIDEHTDLIRGTIKYKSKTDGQEYQLISPEHAWARSRKIDIAVNQKEHTINWKGTMDLNE